VVTLAEIYRWCIYTLVRRYHRVAWRFSSRERLLFGSERKFRALLESAPDAIVIVDWHGHVNLINAQAEELFGYLRGEIVGQSASDLLPERVRVAYRDHQRAYLRDPTTISLGGNHELMGRREDGSEFPIEVSLSPVETDLGLLVLSTIRDITERKHADEQLRYLADHDGLTGLINRRKFEEHLDREIATAVRYDLTGALLLLDIDSLKDVNDTLGHACGDDLIRGVAALLKDRLRDTDVIARFGGDEFAVLLPHIDAGASRELALTLLATLRDHQLVLADQRVRLTASIGVADFGQGQVSSSDVLLAADVALYEAKHAGRDRVAVYAVGADEVAERQAGASWSQRLRAALDEGLLVAHRQPIICVDSGEVEQYELLVRMLDDEGKPIPPISFLPTAERTGMILEIDRLMVSRAIELIRLAHTAGTQPISYAVNLSARSLSDAELPAMVQARLIDAGIDPSLLVFEITETAAIANIEAARDFADSLRELGCGLALDDFGAGFASFYNLKHLPLDWLKIDGEFIRTLPESPTDQLVVEHMVQIARGLGMRTIAEFVEDDQTLQLLTRYGVDRAQGYHIGRPEPVPELVSELAPELVSELVVAPGSRPSHPCGARRPLRRSDDAMASGDLRAARARHTPHDSDVDP
jgi:diguanylate cyclase (GGDEF)-like protein/PAS domain S-box-containing protein